MGLPLVSSSLALVLGGIAAANWPAAWPLGQTALISIVGVVVAVSAVLFKRNRFHAAQLLVVFCFGAALFSYVVIGYQSNTLKLECDGADFTAEFIITDLVSNQGAQERLVVMPTSGETLPCFGVETPQLRLSFWNSQKSKYRLSQGDRLVATVKLRRPHSTNNLGGFDYVAWLWRQDILATGYVKQLHSVTAPTAVPLRQQLKQKIESVLDQHPALGLVLALAIADRQTLTDEQWTAARETGLSHLLAISGLHLGLVAGLILLLARQLLRLATFEKGAPLAASLLPMIAGTAFYGSLAGWPLSTQRAWLMLLVFSTAALVNWRQPRYYAWATALLLCYLLQPLNVLDAGFYLSFGAVAILLWWVHRPATGWLSSVKQVFGLQAVLLLGMLPLQLWFFGGFSLLALPLNLVVVPLFTFLLLPALLLSCLGLLFNVVGSEALLMLVADCLAWFDQGVRWAHGLGQGQWFGWQLLGQPSTAIMALLLVVMLLLAIPTSWRLKTLAVPLMAAVGLAVVLKPSGLEEAEFTITAFDAGQGTAVLIQTRNHNLIYDTGAGWRSGGSAMRSMVLPALANLGVSNIDYIFVSHSDNDHAGGLPDLLKQYPHAEVVGGEASVCAQGLTLALDAVRFDVLWPASGPNKANDDSCVILVASQYGKALLTGDISKAVERKLVNANAPLLADWLLVPHHGSKTSSSLRFINAVSPKVAVITSGHNNRYGLPASSVVENYQRANSPPELLNTATDGAIITTFSRACNGCTQTQTSTNRWWQ